MHCFHGEFLPAPFMPFTYEIAKRISKYQTVQAENLHRKTTSKVYIKSLHNKKTWKKGLDKSQHEKYA